MSEARLASGLRVAAMIRRLDREGIGVAVARKGDETAGAILIKLNQRDLGCVVLVEGRDADGGRAWRRGCGETPVEEAEADAYIARQRAYDSDLWVIEIDDRRGRHLLDEPVL